MKRILAILLLPFTFSLYSASAQTISTYAGNGSLGYSGDGGPATAAELNTNFELFSQGGDVYIADNQNHRGRVVNTSGVITTFAGNGFRGYTGDGGMATAAELSNPASTLMDAMGNIYECDWGSSTVRMINTSGVISTFCGTGTSGYNGDGGAATAAQLNSPVGLAMDASGNIYIGDRYNYRIRMINTSGIIYTIAGNGTPGYSGDGGPATAAEMSGVNGICTDLNNNVYIADYGNDVVRMVNTSDIITTFAGNGDPAYSGDGGPATAAELNTPMGVCSDPAGDIFIADHSNSRIREVLTNGIIYTVVGNGFGGFSGDGGSATAAEINFPSGVCLDASGNVYVSDQGNERVRKVTGISTNVNQLPVGPPQADQLSVYPNPSNGNFTIQSSVASGSASGGSVEVYNVLGEKVYSQIIVHSSSFIVDISNQPNGIYLYRVIANSGNVLGEGKMVIQK